MSGLQHESLIILFSLVVAVLKQLPNTNEERWMSCDNYVITLGKTQISHMIRGDITWQF